jgi:hypothetical protein
VEAPLPTSAPPSPAAPRTFETDLSLRRQASEDDGQLSSLPIIGGIAGLVAIVGGLVVFSLRRRMRDDAEDDALGADEVEDVVLVPAQGGGPTGPSAAVTRSPIPRALTLPRLPAGPVAGSGFRVSEVSQRDEGDAES